VQFGIAFLVFKLVLESENGQDSYFLPQRVKAIEKTKNAPQTRTAKTHFKIGCVNDP
jgi:hypothetical protein